MEEKDTTQRNNVSADGKLAGTPGKYALLDPYREKNIGDIFKVSLRSTGAVEVVNWQDICREQLRPLLRALGIDPETTRYNVDFIKSDDPLAVGYYQLMGIKPLPSLKNKRDADRELKETTLDEFIYGYAMNQWRATGTNLEKALIKPNGGKHEAAFHITQENGVLLIAASWIDIPDTKIVAS
jgi:hypothetical protein